MAADKHRQKTVVGFVIINHLGNLWTTERFWKAEEAQAHIDAKQKRNPSWNLSKHTVVPATFTIKWKEKDA